MLLLTHVTTKDLVNGGVIRLRCPGCRDRVAFETLGVQDLAITAGERGNDYYRLGQRRCPNVECQTHVFVVYESLGFGGNQVHAAYPPQRIDFDTEEIPERVLAVFDEALTCHAQQCYTAAAMLVRKTLEVVCDEREATGRNLQERIAALGGKVILPQPLLDGLDALRLLGNDAAHVRSRDYEQVGEEEVEIAIDVTKEILKATYQLGSIVGRLTALQRENEAPGQGE